MMPWGEDPGWELHSDRQRRGQGKLTVRGESGNRHGRREAGGRQGVTTLQHGQGSISSLRKADRNKKMAMRVRPSLLPLSFLVTQDGKI